MAILELIERIHLLTAQTPIQELAGTNFSNVILVQRLWYHCTALL